MWYNFMVVKTMPFSLHEIHVMWARIMNSIKRLYFRIILICNNVEESVLLSIGLIYMLIRPYTLARIVDCKISKFYALIIFYLVRNINCLCHYFFLSSFLLSFHSYSVYNFFVFLLFLILMWVFIFMFMCICMITIYWNRKYYNLVQNYAIYLKQNQVIRYSNTITKICV